MHYNATKSGVDNLDHLCTLYTCRRKVNRWPVVLFGNCIDVGAVAAFVIWMAKYPEWKSSEGKRRRRIFLLELGQELVIRTTYQAQGCNFRTTSFYSNGYEYDWD